MRIMTKRSLFGPLAALVLAVASLPSVSSTDITIANGVYNNVLLGVAAGTQEPDDGAAFLQQLEDFMNSGSEALNFALDGTASLGDMTVIIPRDWDQSKFSGIVSPNPDMSVSSADILFFDDTEEPSLPNTLQVELCGVPGRQIQIPLRFTSLDDSAEAQYGTMGQILTHEWAHYRYGVHDEHGFKGDAVYPHSGASDEPVSCYAGELESQWKTDCEGSTGCNPTDDNCKLCIDTTANTPEKTQASLGYLPALSEGKFCNAATHVKSLPTPQNLLCGQRSIMEVIEAHPDTANMISHPPAALSITAMAEPIGRVLLLLEIPPDDATEVVDYNFLLNVLQDALSLYQDMEISIMTYTSDGLETSVVTELNFTTIDDYDDLSDYLPDPAPQSSAPSLSAVFTEVMGLLGEYKPGTLVIMPLRDGLVVEGDLTAEIGVGLHAMNVVPSLLYQDLLPVDSVAEMGSFLQRSAAKLHYNISVTDSQGTIDLVNDVTYFVSNPYQLHHTMVLDQELELPSTQQQILTIKYERGTVGKRIAMITLLDSGNIDDVIVQFGYPWSPETCDSSNHCIYTSNSILYYAEDGPNIARPEDWTLYITNSGAGAVTLDVTWSQILHPQFNQEVILVDSWFSHGRSLIADISENKNLTLYASVSNGGYQITSERINVFAEISITYPDTTIVTDVVTLLDDGAGVDIRKDDSVFSYGFPVNDLMTTGSLVEVTKIRVEDIVIIGRSGRRAGSSMRGSIGSALYTMDPDETECCGSFVAEPNLELSYRTKPYRIILTENLPSVITQEEFDSWTMTTPEPPTTTSPSTTPTTTSDDSGNTGGPGSTPTGGPGNTGSSQSTTSREPETTTTSTSGVPANPTEAPGLSSGAIAGIVIGCLAAAAVIGGGVYYLYMKGMYCFASG